MAVAKRQGREKPMKTEHKKVLGPERGPRVEQCSWLAQFTQGGPGGGKEEEPQVWGAGSLERGLPSRLERVFPFKTEL